MKRPTKLFLFAAGVLTLPALSGCGGGGSGTSPNVPVTPLIPLPHSVSAALSDGLTATVAEDRTSVPVGGTVTYTMTLTNNTAQPITFQPVQPDTSPAGGVGDHLTVTDVKANVAFPQGGALEVLVYGKVTTLTPGNSISGTVVVGSDKSQGQLSAAGPYTANVKFTVTTAQVSPLQSPPLATVTVGPLEVDAQ